MSRTDDEELGRRRFQLVRERAVQDAVEKIRHAPAAQWHTLSPADCTLFREILGELWIGLERERWDQYSFYTLTVQDIRALLALGAEVRNHSLSPATIHEMDAVLSHAK